MSISKKEKKYYFNKKTVFLQLLLSLFLIFLGLYCIYIDFWYFGFVVVGLGVLYFEINSIYKLFNNEAQIVFSEAGFFYTDVDTIPWKDIFKADFSKNGLCILDIEVNNKMYEVKIPIKDLDIKNKNSFLEQFNSFSMRNK